MVSKQKSPCKTLLRESTRSPQEIAVTHTLSTRSHATLTSRNRSAPQRGAITRLLRACVRDASSTSASASAMPEPRAAPRRRLRAMGSANPTSERPAQRMDSVKPTSALRPRQAMGSANPTSARPAPQMGSVKPTSALRPRPVTGSANPTSARPASPTAMRTATPAPSAVPSRRGWPPRRPTRLLT